MLQKKRQIALLETPSVIYFSIFLECHSWMFIPTLGIHNLKAFVQQPPFPNNKRSVILKDDLHFTEIYWVFWKWHSDFVTKHARTHDFIQLQQVWGGAGRETSLIEQKGSQYFPVNYKRLHK